MKTEVVIKYDHREIKPFRDGAIGYIDGYVMVGDNHPYAVVVCGENIDIVPLSALMATGGFVEPI